MRTGAQAGPQTLPLPYCPARGSAAQERAPSPPSDPLFDRPLPLTGPHSRRLLHARPGRSLATGTARHAPNFSTEKMRKAGGYAVIEQAIRRLGAKHQEHIDASRRGERRLTGKYETVDINTSHGVANRGCSIRIPRSTEADGFGYLEDRRPSSNCDPHLSLKIPDAGHCRWPGARHQGDQRRAGRVSESPGEEPRPAHLCGGRAPRCAYGRALRSVSLLTQSMLNWNRICLSCSQIDDAHRHLED